MTWCGTACAEDLHLQANGQNEKCPLLAPGLQALE